MTKKGSVVKELVVFLSYGGLPYIHEDGKRNGLIGGNRDNGGAANVDNNWRDNRNDNNAVRLVLQRNIKKIAFLVYIC